MKRSSLLLLFCFLQGCVLGPNYERPLLNIPQSFAYSIKDASEPHLFFWKMLDDIVLDKLVEEALAYNNDLKKACLRIEKAYAIVIQTRAPLFPSVDYAFSFERLRSSETLVNSSLEGALPNPQNLWQIFGQAAWQIDLWGRTRRLVESAKADVCESKFSKDGVIITLVSSVVNSYLQLRGLDEQLLIAEKTKKAYEEAVEYFEKQFKVGQTSLMTLEQAKTQYETAAVQIPQIKKNIVELENSLSILLGSNPRKIPRGKTITQLELPQIPCAIPSLVLTQRADIQQAEANLRSKNAQIGAAIALYFPSISLTGDYGNASEALKTLFLPASNTWNYQGGFLAPLFHAGSIQAQVVQAEKEQKIALYDYIATVQNSFKEVETALYSHTMIKEELEAQKRLVEASTNYTKLATLQYMEGYSPYFVVLQAQEKNFPAELTLAQLKSDLLISFVNIYQALGGPWVEAISL